VKIKLSGSVQKILLVLFCIVVQPSFGMHAADDSPSPAAQTLKTVNASAARRSLERASSLLAAADWTGASFEARLGASYDPAMADFSWIEALSLAAQNAARADILERVEYSLAPGLFWRTYSRDEALVLCARLYAETGKYSAALSRLASVSGNYSSDADYVRVFALYGLGRLDEARSAVAAALDRWPFDSRFARIFLEREAAKNPTEASRKTAAVILSRLYVWEDEDRELLILAVPFESDPAARERNIRIYRGMGKADTGSAGRVVHDPLSALYALEYGLMDEATVAAEILSARTTGIRLSSLLELARLVSSKAVRQTVSGVLDSYDGIVTDDANRDGMIDTRIRYRLGRPVEAVFDRNQDGYPDYTVDCELGSPAVITTGNGGVTVVYDTYPQVRSVNDHGREYTMKPLALAWAPVGWVKQNLNLAGTDFYTIKLTTVEPTLTPQLLVSNAAWFRENDPDLAGGETRVTLEAGVPVSSESRLKGQVYSWTSYARGFPALTKTDRDGDAYFETTKTYSLTGALSSVLIDRNGNRRNEYREQYEDNGNMRLQWDSDENGVYEISWSNISDSVELTEWLHPETGRPVLITVEKGQPRSVRYGGVTLPVMKDPVENIWWINRIPSGSREIVKILDKAFNREPSPVVSCSVTVEDRRIHAVRTGGILFAEIVDE